jgi:hypothetical protein
VRARAQIDLDARIADVERLWFDLSRRSSFVEGFHHVHRVDEGWPARGTLVWDSAPGRRARGRVVERVTRHEPRVGQASEVEDELTEGALTVSFGALPGGGTRLRLDLRWRTKVRRLGPLADLYGGLVLGPRRRAELHDTLARFRRELADETAAAG